MGSRKGGDGASYKSGILSMRSKATTKSNLSKFTAKSNSKFGNEETALHKPLDSEEDALMQNPNEDIVPDI